MCSSLAWATLGPVTLDAANTLLELMGAGQRSLTNVR